MKRADVDEGKQDGMTSDERAELVKLRGKKRVLKMEVEILKRASAYFARETIPQRSYPVVPEFADDGVPVAVTCRVLEVSTSAS